MSETPKKKLVVIEDGALLSMANNAAIIREFPFLSALASRNLGNRGCGRCGRARVERTIAYMSAKIKLAGMDATKKRRLKELLNAQQVRITYRNNSNKVVQLTF